jgi:hypothetical protein
MTLTISESPLLGGRAPLSSKPSSIGDFDLGACAVGSFVEQPSNGKGWFKPNACAARSFFCAVEQLVARLAHNQEVPGSSPGCATNYVGLLAHEERRAMDALFRRNGLDDQPDANSRKRRAAIVNC